jgi:hypothetical protein
MSLAAIVTLIRICLVLRFKNALLTAQFLRDQDDRNESCVREDVAETYLVVLQSPVPLL